MKDQKDSNFSAGTQEKCCSHELGFSQLEVRKGKR